MDKKRGQSIERRALARDPIGGLKAADASHMKAKLEARENAIARGASFVPELLEHDMRRVDPAEAIAAVGAESSAVRGPPSAPSLGIELESTVGAHTRARDSVQRARRRSRGVGGAAIGR